MRYSLTDFDWSVREPLLPMDRRRPRRRTRKGLDGIFWILRAGALWRDLPERSGLIRPHTIAGAKQESRIG